jgi:hypothetical protein
MGVECCEYNMCVCVGLVCMNDAGAVKKIMDTIDRINIIVPLPGNRELLASSCISYMSREGEKETSTNVQGHNLYTRTTHHHSTLTQTKQGITALYTLSKFNYSFNKKFLDSVYKMRTDIRRTITALYGHHTY